MKKLEYQHNWWRASGGNSKWEVREGTQDIADQLDERLNTHLESLEKTSEIKSSLWPNTTTMSTKPYSTKCHVQIFLERFWGCGMFLGMWILTAPCTAVPMPDHPLSVKKSFPLLKIANSQPWLHPGSDLRSFLLHFTVRLDVLLDWGTVSNNFKITLRLNPCVMNSTCWQVTSWNKMHQL